MPSPQKNSFVLSYDFRDIFKNLSSDDKAKLIDSIFDYEVTGKYEKLNGLLHVIFIQIKHYLDRNKKNYQDKCLKNKENANMRWHAVASDGKIRNANDADSDSDGDSDGDIKKEEKIHKREERKAPVPYQKIVSIYHRCCGDVLPTVTLPLEETRKAHLRMHWRNKLNTLDAWESFFKRVAASDWLMGKVVSAKTGMPFHCSFDWLIKPSNATKVREGNYSNHR